MMTMRTGRAMLKAATRGRVRPQKGNVIIEFALIVPLFLTLVFGMVTLSIAMYNKTVLVMATAAGARAGSGFVTGGMTNSAITTRATDAFRAACGNNLISFPGGTVSPPAPQVTFITISPRTAVSVSVTMLNYQGIDFLWSSNMNISAQTTMMVEQ
jgi:Flp pilus assembly protein TadG